MVGGGDGDGDGGGGGLWFVVRGVDEPDACPTSLLSVFTPFCLAAFLPRCLPPSASNTTNLLCSALLSALRAKEGE